MKFSKGFGFAFALLLLASGALVAQDIPLNNWTVPPYTQSSHSGGITTMTDVTTAHPFVGVAPCRVADTRGNGAPIQGGIFANSAERTWDLTGICGIPAGAEAISVNFTVVAAAGIPAGSFLLSWPTGGAPPPTAIMTYGPNQVLSNAAIIVLGPGEQVEINVSGSTHIIMDVNGYWAPIANAANNALVWETSNTGTFGAARIRNLGTGPNVHGVTAFTDSVGAGSAGLFGQATATTATEVYGVRGLSASSGADTAGVFGVADFRPDDNLNWSKAGVRGESAEGFGVFGISEYSAVRGLLTANTTGVGLANGYLGNSFGVDPGGGAAPWAVFGLGDIGASGTKFFVEPHPTDASLVIKYATLEGPEVGTYFRGRAKFDRGTATISVPETFRMVTSEEGLSIQVTPIGEMATVAVVQLSLDKIVVKGSRNVEFFYTVNGVRRGFEEMQVLAHDFMYVPDSKDAPMPGWLSAHQKLSLISNGTYTPDGKVNAETAQRLGWDRIWEARTHPQPRPEPTTP
jgi:hypothetical protein